MRKGRNFWIKGEALLLPRNWSWCQTSPFLYAREKNLYILKSKAHRHISLIANMGISCFQINKESSYLNLLHQLHRSHSSDNQERAEKTGGGHWNIDKRHRGTAMKIMMKLHFTEENRTFADFSAAAWESRLTHVHNMCDNITTYVTNHHHHHHNVLYLHNKFHKGHSDKRTKITMQAKL